MKQGGYETGSAGFDQKIQQGASGGQCGVFAQQITKLPSGASWRVGDSIYDKKQAVKQYAQKGAAFYPGEEIPQPGNSIIFDEGTKWGHVAVVNEVLPDGRLRLTESNWGFDGKVTHDRVINMNDPKIVGFLRTKPSI
jgi:surface antigen